ncbi:MAG: tripartite tricarboxylate transporter substrate binding protein [Burkholderiales bacterium]
MNRINATWFAAIPLAFAAAAFGQTFPTKAVRIIVPFTPGSATDISARAVQQKLSEIWGQSVVIENRSGAGGTIGAAVVAKAEPDGYTLLVHSSGHAANPAIYAKMPYDTAKDLVAIAALAGQPTVLIVAPSSGIKSVAELLAGAKAKPGTFTFGSAGGGSGTHLIGEKFKSMAAIDVVHVPYKGTPEAVIDTIAGRITYYFSPITAALQHVREGRLIALGVSTATESSLLPGVPTVASAGVPKYESLLWTGMFGPVAMPASLVDKINKDVAQALAAPDVKARLNKLGAEPMILTPAAYKQFVAAEIEDAARILKAAGVKAQ